MDAISALASSSNPAIAFFARRDLPGEHPGPVSDLWELREPLRIIRRQTPNGSWSYPGGNRSLRSRENYDQIETSHQLAILVEQYGFTREHPAATLAAEFLLSFQTARATSEASTAINTPPLTPERSRSCWSKPVTPTIRGSRGHSDALLSLLLFEFGDFPMMRRMLINIKRRTEGRELPGAVPYRPPRVLTGALASPVKWCAQLSAMIDFNALSRAAAGLC